MGLHVCLYVPNIIGYFRALLVLIAWCVFSHPDLFLPVYGLSALLDGLDGWTARRLKQTSRFGAWLDVVVDNFGRGMLWSMLYDWGWLVASLEWCTFVCNHNTRGAQWKSSFTESPTWVRAVMAKGFKTPPGVLTIAGLHGMPVWLYGLQHNVLSQFCIPQWLQILGFLLLAAGRLLCLAVEMWCILAHIKHLTKDEDEEKRD
ncbi:hypothetical protein AMEX_G21538 [Astyanax mexicanus]|uniref:CDP-diacylglycerol--inositol 3-phosphatidyltransferase n=1 Tax=Astyanax mexicanus TaxID=7994 RepID=A0A8B9JIL7_ASTMX|nr:hypothetical protein AMEX_G21538 [Astyanax mexicanus]